MDISTLIENLDLTPAQVTQLTNNLAAFEAARLQGLADDVARSKDGSIITRAGLNLLAKACAGKELKYTRCAIGDSVRNGALVTLTDEEILELEGLIHFQKDIPIADVKFAGNGTAVVQCVLQNFDYEQGIWVRELGLFAEDPDTQEEILYSYRNSGLLSGFAPAGSGAVLMNLILNLVTVVDNATNITAIVDANLLFVSQAQLLDHINALEPHPNIPKLRQELSEATQLWSNDADNNLHPITIENLTAQILSPDAAPIKNLANRLSQAETNLSNLFMQVDSLVEMGLNANLLVFEDFIDCEGVDMLKTKVLNTVGGPDDLYVESLDGVLIGHYYTVSDGVRSQFLRVRAVATNDGLCNVMFDEPINRTFNLSKTYLRRTTGKVKESLLEGSGNARESTFAPDDVWSGIQSSTTKTISLTTTQKNAKNFDLSGDYSFTSDGFFTLA